MAGERAKIAMEGYDARGGAPDSRDVVREEEVVTPKVGVLDYLPEQDRLAIRVEPFDATQVALLKGRLPADRVYSPGHRAWTIAPTWATWAIENLVPLGYVVSAPFERKFGTPVHGGSNVAIAGVWSVSDLVNGVRLLLRTHAQLRWVRARLVNYKVVPRASGSYATVELVDVEGDQAPDERRIPGKLPAYLAHEVLARLERRYGEIGLLLEEGLEVVWHGQVVLDRFGRLQFEVRDAHPEHTRDLAILSLERMKRELERAGHLGRNERLTLPEWPLRIGIISSRSADGYRDVLAVLDKSNWNFEIVFEEVALQAQDTPRQVIMALQRLENARVDVIALVRGGGALSDLVVFNDLPLAIAMARCPVPIWVGIGHAVHRVLPDFVGRRFETPTEVARELVSRVDLAWATRQERWRRVADLVRTRLEKANEACSASQRHLGVLVTRLAEREQHRLERQASKIHGVAERCLLGASEHLERGRTRLASGLQALSREETRVSNRVERLVREVGWRLEREDRQIERRDLTLRAHDPARLLSRGFALVTDREGKRIRSAHRLRGGDRVPLRLPDGRASAIIETVDIRPEEN